MMHRDKTILQLGKAKPISTVTKRWIALTIKLPFMLSLESQIFQNATVSWQKQV